MISDLLVNILFGEFIDWYILDFSSYSVVCWIESHVYISLKSFNSSYQRLAEQSPRYGAFRIASLFHTHSMAYRIRYIAFDSECGRDNGRCDGIIIRRKIKYCIK